MNRSICILLMVLMAMVIAGASLTTVDDDASSSEQELFEVDGLKYEGTIDYDLIARVIGHTSIDKDVIIPDQVNHDGWTFKVVSIGDSAMKNCKTITSVKLSNNITSIDKNAFMNCTSLKELVLSENITKIDSGCFRGCSSLKNLVIPDTVKNIGTSAFMDCTALTEITVPASLNTVVKNKSPAFKGCRAIEKVTLTPGEAGSKAHDYNDNTYTPWRISKASFKTLVVSDGITTIGKNTFKNCKGLTQATLPEYIIMIEKSAFEGCRSLPAIDLHTVASLGDYAFKGCELAQITLSESPIKIGKGAFEGCRNLQAMDLHAIVSLGDYAFKNCEKVVQFTLPESITKIGKGTFEGCRSLQSMDLHAIVSIGDYAFKNCSSMENLSIPIAITEISKECFRGCSSFKSLVIPDTVKKIGTSAFMDCTALTEITVPASLNTVVKNNSPAFKGCEAIEKVTLTPGKAGSKAHDYNDNTYTPWCISKASFKTLVISDGITTIGKNTFKNCALLEKLSIPSTIKSIGDKCFCNCTSLENLVIPDTVSKIGKCSFKGCTGLKNISVPISIDIIHWDYGVQPTFEGCINIEHITLTPGNGTACDIERGMYGSEQGINRDAPWGISKSLKTMTIAEGVTEIGAYYFLKVKAEFLLKLPETLKKIGQGAFDGVKIYDTDGKSTLNPTPENLKGSTFKFSKGTMTKQTSN